MNPSIAPHAADEGRAGEIGVLNEALLQRIRGEFREMPGLTLSLRQAARLWSLDPVACDLALRILVEENFLGRTRRGLFQLAE